MKHVRATRSVVLGSDRVARNQFVQLRPKRLSSEAYANEMRVPTFEKTRSLEEEEECSVLD
jgi:hypothetical protein